jgi:hypothetical protein
MSANRPALRACFHFCFTLQSQAETVSKNARFMGKILIDVDFFWQSEKTCQVVLILSALADAAIPLIAFWPFNSLKRECGVNRGKP